MLPNQSRLGQDAGEMAALSAAARQPASSGTQALDLALGAAAALGPNVLDSLLSRAMELAAAMPSVIVALIVSRVAPDHVFLAVPVTLALLRGLETAKIVRADLKTLATTEFTVAGIKHYWTYLGKAEWDGAKVVAALTPLIEEHIRFWGTLPYKKYAFLNIVTTGGGGY
jgi:hypothetical protein